MLTEMSPALAAELGVAMDSLFDSFRDDLMLLDKEEDLKQTWLYGVLPPSGEEYLKKHPRLLIDFFITLPTVALKVFCPGEVALGNRAEELLLTWVVQEAKAIRKTTEEKGDEDCDDLDAFLEETMEDFDYEMLYTDPKKLDPEAVRQMGVGSLAPENWFLPFNKDRITNPLTWPEKIAFWHPNWKNFRYPQPGEN